MQALTTQEFEGIVRQYQQQHPQTAQNSDFQEAALTCTFTVGPQGANLQGWISYYDGRKIHFQATKTDSYWGLAAATVAIPFLLARRVEQVSGKIGRFSVHGHWGAGTLTLLVDGKEVTIPAVPLVATAAFGWGAEGEVVYRLG